MSDESAFFDADELRAAMADIFPEATQPHDSFWAEHPRHVTILFGVFLLMLWMHQYVI